MNLDPGLLLQWGSELQVGYSNSQKVSDHQMVRYSNGCISLGRFIYSAHKFCLHVKWFMLNDRLCD